MNQVTEFGYFISRIAAQQLKPVEGLDALCKWIEKRGLKRAAVTNAPRANAELMISLLGLSGFFEVVIVGGECERSKPFPDPYQKALKHFGLEPNQAFVLEVNKMESIINLSCVLYRTLC